MVKMTNRSANTNRQGTSANHAEASFACTCVVVLLGIAVAMSIFFVFAIILLALLGLIILLVGGELNSSERTKIPVAA